MLSSSWPNHIHYFKTRQKTRAWFLEDGDRPGGECTAAQRWLSQPQLWFYFYPREIMNYKHTTAGCWGCHVLWLCRLPFVYLWQVTEVVNVAATQPLVDVENVGVTNCRGSVVKPGYWRRVRTRSDRGGDPSRYPETDSDARMNERRCTLTVHRLRALLHNTVPTAS